ncbi:MAG: PhnD/SsuA/transferrin family substrate-binding protein [Woeseiaceae bacterium]
MVRMKFVVVLLGMMLLYPYVNAQAEGLIFTSPPRESKAKGEKMYNPIAAHLTKTLGVKVTYVHPGNFLNYQREMRNDKYDIIIDGPHFIAWRIAHLGHEALIKLPGKLQFVLVTEKSNTQYKSPDDLIGKSICGISPPHLSILSVLDYYRNPVRQPIIKGVRGGMKAVHKKLINEKKKCDAGVFRTVFLAKKLSKEQNNNLKTLYLSQVMPNQGLSVSRRVSQRMKDKITNELSIGKGVASTKAFIKRFAGKAKSMIPVKPKEYDGYNTLLEGVIFGW